MDLPTKSSPSNKLKVQFEEQKWTPINILEAHNILDYVVIVLNTELKVPSDVAKILWNNAKYRITVDGGTNRWFQFLKTYCQNDEMKPPDFITGDFDSVKKDTLDHFYNSLKIHTPNQNETDFTKSLRVMKQEIHEEISNIIVFQENSGRFDQIMANINTLFKSQDFLPKTRIFLLSSNSLSWLLRRGKHSIEIPSALVAEQVWCCLIPIGKKCRVTTDGLKWNLDDTLTEFGGMVSTSNTYGAEVVEIITDGDLLWCMGCLTFSD